MNESGPLSSPLSDELPKNIELFEVFRDVLNRWAYLDCVPQGPAVDGFAKLPLERSVTLSGNSLTGLLMLRSDLNFGRLLAESAAGEAAGDAEAQDAFTELCNQFCSHAMSELWDADQAFAPFLPVKPRPEERPTRAADRRCLISVDHSPVEIHFWRTHEG